MVLVLVNFRAKDTLVHQFDEAVKNAGFTNRTVVLRQLLARYIREQKLVESGTAVIEKASKEKVNWNYYRCQRCGDYGDAHMISEQARLELCNDCYAIFLRKQPKTIKEAQKKWVKANSTK